ncbi:MAG TPA: cytochrome c biogenesis protein CcdA [Acidimicrobiales bacterium]|nr:cytochrome c biogenesis protein CcdA [Acidimicrobiales bacterium]
MADPSIPAAFGAGVLSFLSPCVLPLVPGYLAMMSGLSGAELAEEHTEHQARILRSTLLFVSGFSVVFVALGAGASAIGSTLNEHERGLNQITGAVVIVMGLFLAGVASPRLFQAERRFHATPSRLGPYAAPVMGMAFAFGWTPCLGPILAALLSLAATNDTVTKGAALLLVYSIGLGVPFVLSGLALARMQSAFAFVKRHYRVINAVAGVILVAFGALLFTNRLSLIASNLVEFFDDHGLAWMLR